MMKKLLNTLLYLAIGILTIFIWSFTRSGYSSSDYFKPTVILSLFFLIGYIIRLPYLKITKLNVWLIFLPSVGLITLTYFSHKLMFIHDFPLLPIGAIIAALVGYYSYSAKIYIPISSFLIFLIIGNVLYVNTILQWDYSTNKVLSTKNGKNLYEPLIKHDLLTKDSTRTEINNFKGKVVLLDFYRNSCSPCIRQLPRLQKLDSAFASENFQVLLLNTGSRDNFKQTYTNKFFSNKGLSILYDLNSSLTKHLNVQGVPQQFLLDKNGNVLYHATGGLIGKSEDYKYKRYEELIKENL